MESLTDFLVTLIVGIGAFAVGRLSCKKEIRVVLAVEKFGVRINYDDEPPK